MGNIEKYGVLALIFVIVLILAVAICNGPGDTGKENAPQPPAVSVTPGGGENPQEIANRAKIRDYLEEQKRLQLENANKPAAQPAPKSNGTVEIANVSDTSGRVERSPAFKTHIVEKGETLETIAKKELGARTRWQELVRANEGLDPKRLKIGQSILVPVSDEVALGNTKEEDRADRNANIKPVKKPSKETPTLSKSTR